MYELDNIHWEEFPDHMVYAVDKVIDKAKERGCSKRIEGSAGWKTANDIFKLWKRYFPHEYVAFMAGQNEKRSHAFNTHASSKEKGGAVIRHLCEIPQRLYKMWQDFFPDQDFTDKEFVIKLIKEFPDLRIPSKI